MNQASRAVVPATAARPGTTAREGVAGAAEGRDRHKYLAVTVQGEAYGVEVLKIREIIEYSAETALPMMPQFVRGAINLRGTGVPVIDLGLRLGGSETSVGRRSCIVIVEAPAGEMEEFDVGLLVDAVNEVVDIEPQEIEPAPSFGGRLKNDFLRGMGKVKGRFVKLLDVDRVLDPAAMGSAPGDAVRAEP